MEELLVLMNPDWRERPFALDVSSKGLCWPFVGQVSVQEPICVFSGMVRVHVRASGRSGMTDNPIRIMGRRPGLLLQRTVMQGRQKSDSGPHGRCLLGTRKLSCLSQGFQAANPMVLIPKDIIEIQPSWQHPMGLKPAAPQPTLANFLS